MLGCLKLFLHRKSDFTFRHNIPECSAHTLFSINFVHISRMLTYSEYHERNRTPVSYFLTCSKQDGKLRHFALPRIPSIDPHSYCCNIEPRICDILYDDTWLYIT